MIGSLLLLLCIVFISSKVNHTRFVMISMLSLSAVGLNQTIKLVCVASQLSMQH